MMRNVFAGILLFFEVYSCYMAVSTNTGAWCVIFAVMLNSFLFLKTIELEDALKDHERRLGYTQAVITAMLSALGWRIEEEDEE